MAALVETASASTLKVRRAAPQRQARALGLAELAAIKATATRSRTGRQSGRTWDALLAAVAEHIAINPRPPRAEVVRRPGAVAADLLDAAARVREALSGLCLPGHTRSLPAPWRHGR